MPSPEDPQSTSVSLPFLILSLALGAAHFELVQTPSAQSPPLLHAPPVAHPLQDPPQSTPVSSPFFSLSLHVGAAQVPPAPVHTRFTQSDPSLHPSPSPQGGANVFVPSPEDPQSTPVSLPFFTWSLLVGLAHRWLLVAQTPSAQSLFVAHFWLIAHGAQLPPQSTSVSSPFFTPSLHVSATHRAWSQCWLMQSEFFVHASPSAHGGSAHVAATHRAWSQCWLMQSEFFAHALPSSHGGFAHNVGVTPLSPSLTLPSLPSTPASSPVVPVSSPESPEGLSVPELPEHPTRINAVAIKIEFGVRYILPDERSPRLRSRRSTP